MSPSRWTDSNEDIVLSGETAPNYAENGTGNVATYTATDGDGGTITGTLSGDDESLFDIAGGVLTFNSSPDYETSRPTKARTTNTRLLSKLRP